MPVTSYQNVVRTLGTPGATGEQLHDAAIALRDAFMRNEHSIGLLPGDAPELLVRALRAGGDQGHIPSLLTLALLFQRGSIAPWAPFPARDVPAAIELYRRADALGSPEGAMGWIRAAYFARDEQLATAAATRLGELHTQSPEDAGLMLFLGYFLHQGYGYAPDATAAARFFEAAAARGDAAAAFELTILYATGDGVPADPDSAQQWTFRAAELGSPRAQANLGGMYATGRGVPKDAALAVDWYRRAGESGNARAAFVAGVMLLTGDDGLPADPVAASAQFDTAEEFGYDVDATLAGMGLHRPE